MQRKTRVVVWGLIICAWCVASGSAQQVGFREDFSSADGWEVGTWPGITGVASITSDTEQTTFATLAGTFLTGSSGGWTPDWPDWDQQAPAGLAMVTKKYPLTVDLDRYHFLVADMTHAGTYMALGLNGWDTKACYTTGLHVVDLRDIEKPSLRGQQSLELRLTFLNTGAQVKLNEMRLVESLSPAEQAALIPAGLDLRLEHWEPQPYHGLEALNDRAAAPIRFDLPEEKAVFRDTSTAAAVWKLTRSVRGELGGSFNADGSALPIYSRSFRGMVVYDLALGGMRELKELRGAPVFSRIDPAVIYLLDSTEADGVARYTVRSVNFRSGATEQVAEWESRDQGAAEFGMSPYSDLLQLGLKEGRAIYFIDPRKEPPSERVRRVPLPMRMKGSYLSHNDRRVNWQRCYYFQRWQMDLETGKIQIGHYPTYGGHEIFGRDCLVGRYGAMMLTHSLGLLPCDEQQADEVRIWSNWKTEVPSDYGQLSDDDRWLVTNGTDGAVAGKRLLIDGRETGTVLQIVHDFSSRNSWDSNTYSRISPDATKLVYMSDMLGDTDVYMALARRPESPRNVTVSSDGDRVHLHWQPPKVAREIAGYNVYRSYQSGRGYRRINRERIDVCEFEDVPSNGPVFYAVAAEEHSGLEGLYSAEVHIADSSTNVAHQETTTYHRIYADFEEGELSPPMRQYFDGNCSNFRCARVWKETPQELTGQVTLNLNVPVTGKYVVWVRSKGQGAFQCNSRGVSVPGLVDSEAWSWIQVASPLQLHEGKQRLIIESSDDGLCFDIVMLTNDSDDTPQRLDDRDPIPSLVKGLRATELTAQQVRLAWDPNDEVDLDGYSVHVGNRADFVPGNASLLSTGAKVECLDWGFPPGAVLYYKVVASNKRGGESEPAAIRVEIPQMETAFIELDSSEAALSEGLVRSETNGVVSVFVPAPQGQVSPRAQATWQVEVPHDGVYYVWARYTTLDAKRVSQFWIACDGDNPLQGMDWRLRFPCTLTRHLDGVAPDEATWFTDKMATGWWAGPFDSFPLKAGRRTVSVAFDPTHAPNGPRLAGLFLSSDPSYHPPGFDPRIDFRK